MKKISRTLIEKGDLRDAGFKIEPCKISNHKLIVTNDDKATPVGVIEEGPLGMNKYYLLGDRVDVKGDIIGYICPGVVSPGRGEIVEIQRDIDHYYGVRMDDGEFGYMKSARIEVIPPCKY